MASCQHSSPWPAFACIPFTLLCAAPCVCASGLSRQHTLLMYEKGRGKLASCAAVPPAVQACTGRCCSAGCASGCTTRSVSRHHSLPNSNCLPHGFALFCLHGANVSHGALAFALSGAARPSGASSNSNWLPHPLTGCLPLQVKNLYVGKDHKVGRGAAGSAAGGSRQRSISRQRSSSGQQGGGSDWRQRAPLQLQPALHGASCTAQGVN